MNLEAQSSVRLRPFFSYYGAKYRAAPTYPAPKYSRIVEPFAGSACYSLNWPMLQVELNDLDPRIVGIWEYLLTVRPERVLQLPLVEPGQQIAEVSDGLTRAEMDLVGFWCHKGSPRPGRKLSVWALDKKDKAGLWGHEIRARIARQISTIEHWKASLGSYRDLDTSDPATWFIDPPYRELGRHYTKGSRSIDFEDLADWCRSLPGQVIVCEAEGADWLPFEPHGSFATRTGSIQEVVWTQG